MFIPEASERDMDQIEVFGRSLALLQSSRHCALATVTELKPRVRAMEYAVDDAGVMYMLTEGGRKVRDILLNPPVSVSVWESDAPAGLFWGLTITARAEVVDLGEKKRFDDYYEKYKQHIGRDMPKGDELPPRVKLIRVVPDMFELFNPSFRSEGFSSKQVWRR